MILMNKNILKNFIFNKLVFNYIFKPSPLSKKCDGNDSSAK